MGLRVLIALLLVSLALAAGPAARVAAAEKSKKASKTASLPPEEVYNMALEKMAKKRYLAARTLLQETMPRIPPEDRDLLPKVQLAIADSFYRDGGIVNYGEALNSYRNFLTYFPQHEMAVYAQYMVGMSMYEQVLAPDRDQTMTLKAIDELRKVEALHPESPYAKEAATVIDQCHDRLAEKERLVGRFYQRRHSWPAAVDRYRFVVDHYPRYNNTNRLLLDLGTCLLALNRKDEAQQVLDRLAREDRTGKFTKQAQSRMNEYERRREKEGEKLYGDLSEKERKKAPGS
jgi:outer membrane protein assembly factor BamD